MGNKHKAKGTSFETSVLKYLHNYGFVEARRTALQGGGDTGDINGIKAPSLGNEVALQCKNQRAFDLSGWLNATVEQAAHISRRGRTGVPLLVIKRPGKGEASLGESYAVMELQTMMDLLSQAGYE